MNTSSWYLAIGLTVCALIIGIGIGYYITPEYKSSMYDAKSMNLGLADRTFDLRYINAMIAHHRGAMLLAQQAERVSTRPEVLSLTQAILTDEPKAIAELYAWKKDWYNDTKIVRDPVVARLGPAGETFDLRFLNALIAHHEAGIVMTKETLLKSSRAEILDNANAVEQFLSGGIAMLKQWRSNWYNI